MKRNTLHVLLVMSCVAIVIGFVYAELKIDKVPPQIQVEDRDIEYKNGDDSSKLLDGVTAIDDRDGDISSELFVYMIMDNNDGETATVFYGVEDSSKNISIASRKVRFAGTEGTKIQIETSEMKALREQVEDSDASTEDEAGEDVTGNAEVDRPVLTLSQDVVRIGVGENFNILSYISGITDSVDDETTLYSNIRFDGEINTQVPGTYVLEVYVVNSVGNISDKKQLTVIVG